MAMKTYWDKQLDKLAPETPLDTELFLAADRVMLDLKMSIANAKRLLDAADSGAGVEVNNVSLPLHGRERSQLFGIVWPSVLKDLTYREFHATRFVHLPKDVKKDLMSVRSRIDERQNS